MYEGCSCHSKDAEFEEKFQGLVHFFQSGVWNWAQLIRSMWQVLSSASRYLTSFTRMKKKKLYTHADVLVLLHKLDICTWVSRWPALSPEAMLISLACAAPEGYGGVLGPCRKMAVLMSVVCIATWDHAELFGTFYCLQRPYVSPWSVLPWL